MESHHSTWLYSCQRRTHFWSYRSMDAKEKMSKVVIGYDCRFGGKMFQKWLPLCLAITASKFPLAWLCFPMVSLAVVQTMNDLGVVITACTQSSILQRIQTQVFLWRPTIPSDIEEVEALIPKPALPTCLPLLSCVKRIVGLPGHGTNVPRTRKKFWPR